MPLKSQEGDTAAATFTETDPNLDTIVARLSRERLRKYLARTEGNVEKALALYEWNHKIGAVLTITMQQLEVCLRNKISDALSARSVKDSHGPEWHTSIALKHRSVALSTKWTEVFDKAVENRNGFQPALPDFIAAASFNFWRELCKPDYAAVFWGKSTPTHFQGIPKNAEARVFLTLLHSRVDLTLKLRNRIAHHEPIIGASPEPVGKKLRERHRDMTEVLNWMDGDFARWVLRADRFEQVLSECPVSCAPPLPVAQPPKFR